MFSFYDYNDEQGINVTWLSLAMTVSSEASKINMSHVLDALLEGYDKRLRPGFG
ncbi:unnamed protein product, partial [Candidula unifasciata]